MESFNDPSMFNCLCLQVTLGYVCVCVAADASKRLAACIGPDLTQTSDRGSHKGSPQTF